MRVIQQSNAFTGDQLAKLAEKIRGRRASIGKFLTKLKSFFDPALINYIFVLIETRLINNYRKCGSREESEVAFFSYFSHILIMGYLRLGLVS